MSKEDVFRAVKNNDLDKLQLLLSSKADVNLKELHNNTPLHYACHHKNSDIKIVRCLVENKADVNAKSNYHYTSLDLACGKWNSNIEIIRYLIENGADCKKDIEIIKSNHQTYIPFIQTQCKAFFKNVAICMLLSIKHSVATKIALVIPKPIIKEILKTLFVGTVVDIIFTTNNNNEKLNIKNKEHIEKDLSAFLFNNDTDLSGHITLFEENYIID